MAAPYEVLVTGTYAGRQKGRPLLVEVRLVPRPVMHVERVAKQKRVRVTRRQTRYILAAGEQSARYRPGSFVSADYAARYPSKVRRVVTTVAEYVTGTTYVERQVEVYPDPPKRSDARRLIDAFSRGEFYSFGGGAFDVVSTAWGRRGKMHHNDLRDIAAVLTSPKFRVEVEVRSR